MIFLIGGNGFVGSAYERLLSSLGLEHHVITRENYAEFVGRHCDVLINANGNSKKFLSDKDPKLDFDLSVRSVVAAPVDNKADTYVFLSSGDVYPSQISPDVTREDQAIDLKRVSRYGLHKYTAEMMVTSLHSNYLVVRMGGFVGPGLRKNAIFDMLTNQKLWLKHESNLQFIRTDTAARLVWTLVERGIRNETVNLGARGCVGIGDLYARIGSTSELADEARSVRFEIAIDKLTGLLGAMVPSSVDEVEAFLQEDGR